MKNGKDTCDVLYFTAYLLVMLYSGFSANLPALRLNVCNEGNRWKCLWKWAPSGGDKQWQLIVMEWAGLQPVNRRGGLGMSLRVFPFNARIYLKCNARLLTLWPASCTLLQNQQLFLEGDACRGQDGRAKRGQAKPSVSQVNVGQKQSRKWRKQTTKHTRTYIHTHTAQCLLLANCCCCCG